MEKSLRGAHSVGQMVLVPWQNSSRCFSRLEEIDAGNGTCLVEFKDSTKAVVSLADVASARDPSFGWPLCGVCMGRVSCAPNVIVLCNTCDTGFHQRCHSPSISTDDLALDSSWVCCYCADGRRNPYALNRPTREMIPSSSSLQLRKRKNDRAEGPPAKRVLRRRALAPAELYRRRSLSDGESDRTSSDYETSSGSHSPESPACPLATTPFVEGAKHEDVAETVPLARTARNTYSGSPKDSLRQGDSANEGENGDQNSKGKDGKGALSAGENDNSVRDHKATDRVNDKSGKGEGEDEEEFIDVEGDDDNSAGEDELDHKDSDSRGSARTRGDIQWKTNASLLKDSLGPAGVDATSPSDFTTSSTSSPSQRSCSPSSSMTLLNEHLQTDNNCLSPKLPTTTSFYATWVAKATAGKTTSESSHTPLSVTTMGTSQKASHAQTKPFQTTLVSERQTTSAHSAKPTQQIAMPRLYDNCFGQVLPTERPPSRDEQRMNYETTLTKTHTHPISGSQKSAPVFNRAGSVDSADMADVGVAKRQIRDGHQHVKTLAARSAENVELQNPFRQWVFSNAQQPKNEPTSSTQPQRPATPSAFPLKTPQRSGLRLQLSRSNSSDLSTPAKRSRHRLSTDSNASTKRQSGSPMFLKPSQQSLDSAGSEELRPNLELMARLSAGYLFSPIAKIRAKNEDQQTNPEAGKPYSAQPLRTPVPLAARQFQEATKSLYLTSRDLMRTAIGSGQLCHQTADRPMRQLIDDFTAEYNNIVSRFQERHAFPVPQ